MPKVPTYDNFTVEPAVNPNVKVSAPDFQNFAAAQQGQEGQAMQSAGTAVSRIAADLQNDQNLLRVRNARTQLLTATQGLEYGDQSTGQQGFLSLKGENALKPDANGQSVPQTYADKFNQTRDQIMDSLGNGAQKEMFMAHSEEMFSTFNAKLQSHMMMQSQEFARSTNEGAIKSASDQAGMNWNNPKIIEQSIQDAKFAAVDQGRRDGVGADLIEHNARAVESAINARVIKMAMTSDNPEYAMAYFNAHKQGMLGNDVLEVLGTMTHQFNSTVSQKAVAGSSQQFNSAFQPSDMDRLHGIVGGMESSNQEIDPKTGKQIEGPNTKYGTAKGKMQVLDGTNIDPGFGVTPAKDDSPEERARVGRDYIDAMVKRYGDVGQALAAYHAGPGNVDDAIKKATQNGGNYLQYLGPKTQAYVKDGVAEYGAGRGAPPMPTKQDFVTDAITRLGPNPSTELVSMTRDAAERQYKLTMDSRKEQGDQALHTAQQELISNGGNFDALPPQMKQDLSKYDPAAYTSAMTFAKNVANDKKATNMDAYNKAITYPEELAKMSDAQFLQFQMDNFSVGDREKIAKIRADYVNGKEDQTVGAINTKALNDSLNDRLSNMGINPSPKKDDTKENSRIGAIKKFLMDGIYDAQRQSGRKFSPEEVDKYVVQQFSRNIQFKGNFLSGDSTEVMLKMKVGDLPTGAAKGITLALQREGNLNPTDSDIMVRYWKMHNGSK